MANLKPKPLVVTANPNYIDNGSTYVHRVGDSIVGERFESVTADISITPKNLPWFLNEVFPRMLPSDVKMTTFDFAKAVPAPVFSTPLQAMQTREVAIAEYKGDPMRLMSVADIDRLVEERPELQRPLHPYRDLFRESPGLVLRLIPVPGELVTGVVEDAESGSLTWDDVAVVGDSIGRICTINAHEDRIARMSVGLIRELIASSRLLLAESDIQLFIKPDEITKLHPMEGLDLEAIEKLASEEAERSGDLAIERDVRQAVGYRTMHEYFRDALAGFIDGPVPEWARAWANLHGSGRAANRLQEWVVDNLKADWMTGIGAIEAAESMLVEALRNGNLTVIEKKLLEPRDLWTLWDFQQWRSEQLRENRELSSVTLPTVVFDHLLEDVAHEAGPQNVKLETSLLDDKPMLFGIRILKGGRL